MRTESISPSGLGTDGLKDLTGLHQVLDVLTQHGVLGLQPEVFLLHFVHPLSEVVQGVLQLQHLRDQPRLLLLLVRGEVGVEADPVDVVRDVPPGPLAPVG